MNKLGTELANAWMKKTLVDLNGFSENEIPKNRDEAYKALNLFFELCTYLEDVISIAVYNLKLFILFSNSLSIFTS